MYKLQYILKRDVGKTVQLEKNKVLLQHQHKLKCAKCVYAYVKDDMLWQMPTRPTSTYCAKCWSILYTSFKIQFNQISKDILTKTNSILF